MERLCSWLARVQGADPLLDAALDDAQREFLLSYRLPEGGGDAAAPGAPAAAPQRQFILPQRASRSGSAGASAGSAAAAADGSNGNGCDACATLAGDVSRASSEEVEAGVNDPELQEVLRTVSWRGRARRRAGRGRQLAGQQQTGRSCTVLTQALTLAGPLLPPPTSHPRAARGVGSL